MIPRDLEELILDYCYSYKIYVLKQKLHLQLRLYFAYREFLHMVQCAHMHLEIMIAGPGSH